jgi:hypothetical protein
MLPNDVKARKDNKKLNQETLDPYLTEWQPTEHSKPYSNQAFKMAAIEWIIAIDQDVGFYLTFNYSNQHCYCLP